MAMDVEEQVIEVLKKSRYFAIPLDDKSTDVIMPFFFVLCIIWEMKISRKNSYVGLTYQDVPPGQRYLEFLTNNIVRQR